MDTKSSFSLTILAGTAESLPILLIIVAGFPSLSAKTLLFGFVAGFLRIAGFLPFAVSISKEEITIVPLWNMAPILVLALSYFFLNERLPPNFFLAL